MSAWRGLGKAEKNKIRDWLIWLMVNAGVTDARVKQRDAFDPFGETYFRFCSEHGLMQSDFDSGSISEYRTYTITEKGMAVIIGGIEVDI